MIKYKLWQLFNIKLFCLVDCDHNRDYHINQFTEITQLKNLNKNAEVLSGASRGLTGDI